MNYLKGNYYFNNDGTRDEIVDWLGDCIIQCAYIILKNTNYFKPEYCKAFLNETTIKLSMSNNELIGFETVENVFDKELFLIYDCNEKNQNTSDIVSSILKKGEIPAVAAIIERFPFSAFYDENYTLNKKRTKHVFIIVGEDKENFYYVDSLGVISNERFMQYSKNKEVGIISKKIFDNASKDDCNILNFEYNTDQLEKRSKNSFDVLVKSRDNYSKNAIVTDNVEHFFGKQALNKFYELFEKECLKFTDLAPSKDRDVITYFSWKIWNIKGRRNLQKFYFEKYFNIENINKKILISLLNETVEQWDLLYKILYKDFLKGAVTIGNKYIPTVRQIIDVENKLNSALTDFLMKKHQKN